MAGKRKSFDADKAWANASAKAKSEGTTLTALIGKRDKGDKEAQAQINKYYGMGGETSDVRSDYNAQVDKNKRGAMKTANRILDKTSMAALDVSSEVKKSEQTLDTMKKRKKNKKDMWAGE